MIVQVHLAGTPIPDDDIRELAGLVDEPTRAVLEKALTLGTKIVALTIVDRESILRALDEPPSAGLAELRGLLLREHE